MKIDIPQITVGVDLGDTKHFICVLNQAGNYLEERIIENSEEDLFALAQTYPGARIAMEVGTHSPWISELLTGEGCDVFVANARKLRAIYASERKCDELDARMLAKIARLDTSLLSPIRHISQDALKDRLVLGMRERLVEQRKALIQSVRFSIKSLGRRLESCSASVFAKRARRELEDDADLLETLEPTIATIETMNAGIKTLDKKIARLNAEKYVITERFQQVTGVGPITSLCFALVLEDPNRIEKTRDVGAYLGIVPRRDQSGDVDKMLGISKTGNGYLRKLLVQCSQYILGRHGPDSDLRRFGLKLAERGGKAAKKKALVAVARKLAVLLLSLWKSGKDYEPLRHGAASPLPTD